MFPRALLSLFALSLPLRLWRLFALCPQRTGNARVMSRGRRRTHEITYFALHFGHGVDHISHSHASVDLLYQKDQVPICTKLHPLYSLRSSGVNDISCGVLRNGLLLARNGGSRGSGGAGICQVSSFGGFLGFLYLRVCKFLFDLKEKTMEAHRHCSK